MRFQRYPRIKVAPLPSLTVFPPVDWAVDTVALFPSPRGITPQVAARVPVVDDESRELTLSDRAARNEEGFERDWPTRIEMDDETKSRVDAMWEQLGVELPVPGTR